LLILNADDLGMCGSVNEGVLGAIMAGTIRSTSLMMPCPSAQHAIRLLQEHPEVPFAIHLTVVCESTRHRWGPLASPEAVPSLVDESGRFHQVDHFIAHIGHARLSDLEVEFRAQIGAATAVGLRPTHLDWHCLPDGGRPDVFEMTAALATEHGLALRVHQRSRIEQLQARGLPTTTVCWTATASIPWASRLATLRCCMTCRSA
jgi:predicted glycoside hydrolase/deacetylase ChbG (UPF0249 family)